MFGRDVMELVTQNGTDGLHSFMVANKIILLLIVEHDLW